jgi:hypothetical protein
MSKLSGIRDLDREILGKLEDVELLKACSIDKYSWNIVCDDGFLKRRLTAKYPEIERYKSEDETWKSFFSKTTCYIELMKEKYDYDYSFGNFITQYKLFEEICGGISIHSILINFSKVGELALVIWLFSKYDFDIYAINDSFVWACANGHLEVVKYLFERGAEIHFVNDSALREASQAGQLNIVKYLVEKGADIHAGLNYSLRWASENGHFEVVKYLVESGADIHAEQDYALRWAVNGGHFKIVKYLVEMGANIHANGNEKTTEIRKLLKIVT